MGGESAAGLGRDPASDERHGFRGLGRREVVQQQAIHPANLESRPDLIEVSNLHHHGNVCAHGLQVPVRSPDGSLHASRVVDVVVLDEDLVVEAHAVVNSTADDHRPLLEEPQAGGRLACVQHPSASSVQGVHRLPGRRGDPAHALHEVEGKPLGCQDLRRRSFHPRHHDPGRHAVPVFCQLVESHVRRPVGEDGLGDVQTGQHPLGLDEESSRLPGIGRHAGFRGDISRADILRPRRRDGLAHRLRQRRKGVGLQGS